MSENLPLAYFQNKVFGLLSSVERPTDDERFPIASGVIVHLQGLYVFLTVAHYLRDVNEWTKQRRLKEFVLFHFNETGFVETIPLERGKNRFFFCEIMDFGFIVLHPDVVKQLSKKGAELFDTSRLGDPAEMQNLFVVGISSHYSKVAHIPIASSPTREWVLPRLSELAMLLSRLTYEGEGPEPGTHKFVLVTPYESYSGLSGGPIFGYVKGSTMNEYQFIALQASQIRGATADQKPTHLIATSAPLVLHFIEQEIKRHLAE